MSAKDKRFAVSGRLSVSALGLAVFLSSSAEVAAQLAPELITVTATRREENINGVDISLSVIDAAEIESLNLLSLPELASLAQNVSLFEDFPGAGIPTWVIRGVGLQDFNSNNTPAAAVYLDGNYQVSTVMGSAGLFDVQQVEILKGPQGGLYGRNTSGGTVLLNTRRPAPGKQVAISRLGTVAGNAAS
jgi:iron complex outermembrane receptor protein